MLHLKIAVRIFCFFHLNQILSLDTPHNGRWNYICILLDLYNREIIGYAAGKNKDAKLVYKAFTKIKRPLEEIGILHTDYAEEKTMPKNFDFRYCC